MFFPGPSSICVRDVIFMAEDSQDRSGEQYIKQFLINVTSTLSVGRNDSRVALALFDTDVNTKLHMDHHQTNSEVLSTITSLNFRHKIDRVDYDDVTHNLVDYTNRHREGDRADISDVIIIVSDHGNYFNTHHIPLEHLSPVSFKDTQVIVVNIGAKAAATNLFNRLATDSDHTVNVADYQHLESAAVKVASLICQ